MLESKIQVKEMAADLGIKIKGLNEMPEFGFAPVVLQVAPGKRMQVPGRQYTVAIPPGVEDPSQFIPIREVSEKYAMVQHWEAIGGLLEGLQDHMSSFGNPEINLRFSGAGNSRMFNDVRWTEAEHTVAGDTIIPILRQENSVDSSRRFLSQFRAERLVCTNGMTVPDKRFPNQDSVRKLHKLGTLDLEDTLKITMENMGSFADTIKKWDDYKNVTISKEQYQEVLEKMKISEKQQEVVASSTLRGFNTNMEAVLKNGSTDLWTAYNSVTQWISDNTENPATEADRSRIASEQFEMLVV